MRKTIGLVISLLSIIAILTACSRGHDLEQKVWIVESFAQESIKVRSFGNMMPSLTLAEGEVWGNLGLNDFNGTYEILGEEITFSQLSSTDKVGLPEATKQEATFLGALQAAVYIEVQENVLTISDSTNTPLIYLTEGIEG